MQPLSPREASLPPAFRDIRTSDNRQRARAVQEIAQQCLDSQDEDGYEACLREAHNTWLLLDYDPKAMIDGCEAVLLQLASSKKSNNELQAALQLFERCSALMELRRKKLGGLGNPQILLLHSETLSASGDAEEGAEVAKRGIDLLFRRYAHCKNLGEETTRDERVLFGQAWQSLAVAEECQISQSATDEERSTRAVVALVHYRRGVKCCKDLLGAEDPATISMERRYNAAKKTLGKLAAAASKDHMPPAVAAYPTDKSAPCMVFAAPIVPEKPSDDKSPNPKHPPAKPISAAQRRPSNSEQLPVRRGSAARVRSSSVVDSSASPPKATSARQTVAAARLSQGAPPVAVPLQRKATATRLEPLLDSTASPKKSLSGRELSSSLSQLAAVSSMTSSTDATPKKTPRKPVAIVLPTALKRGLQIFFHAAVSKKRSFRALRSVYLFTRDIHPSFPHFQLVLDRSLYDGIQTNEHRLDAMERGPGHTTNEANIANRIRQRRSIDEIRKKRLEVEQVNLFADMDKRTERNARRYKTVMQAITAFTDNLEKTFIRNAFRKWMMFLGPRRRTRPLRRAAAHLFKQIDRGLLRRRFITWIRWLKERKRSVFVYSRKRSNAQNDNMKRALQLISDQEAEDEAARQKERRVREEEEAYEQHRKRLEAMQTEILESIATAEAAAAVEPQEEPPKVPVSQFIADEMKAFLAEINVSETGDADHLEAAKEKLAEKVRTYAGSEDYEKEIRRLPCDAADMEALTRLVSPFMISIALDEELHSEFNIELIRLILKHLHPWVDFHHIFFEDGVLLGIARAGNAVLMEALLDGIPGFVVSSMGTYATGLLEVCTTHDTKAVQLLEVLLLKCEGIVPYHDVKEMSSSILHSFFDRWVPSLARSFQRRGTLYDISSDFSMRARVMTLFERTMLDVRSFSIPHDKELPDKQTLLSRMCGGGDLELVELYTSLLDEADCRNLLSRKQSDGTTCLIQAVRSRNSSLVRFLLDTYDYIVPQLMELYEGQSVLQICIARGCGEDMTQLLGEHGVEDNPLEQSQTSQASRMSNVFGEASDEDIDHLFDDAQSHQSSVSDLSFYSPKPPSEGSSGFQRFGV